MLERLRSCGLRYRRFALDNRHFYAIMFEAALVEQSSSAEVAEHAAAASTRWSTTSPSRRRGPDRRRAPA